MSSAAYPKVKFVDASGNFAWGEKFSTERKILPKGWTKDGGRKPFPIDVIWEKDVPIKMRDGVTLYGDIFRSLESEHTPQPALLPWSPYGKTGAGEPLGKNLEMETLNLSKESKPWTCFLGTWVFHAQLRVEWRNGKHLTLQNGAREAMCRSMWMLVELLTWRETFTCMELRFIAAENPPRLKCIAPWEGLGNYYRESICRGGIPDHTFWDALFTFSGGKNKREDVSGMVDEYPLWNAYWEDKNPKLGNINVPMYATCSYSTGLHTEGSLRGFLLAASAEKWLRFTITQEWHDIYQPERIDDLQKFLDHYMISADNGWKNTPQFRLSLQGYNRPSVVDRPVTSYPPPEFKYQTLYLDAANKSLSKSPVDTAAATNYDAEARGGSFSHFEYKFDQHTELCGFSKAKLFMSTSDHDDMDMYVLIRKLDAAGNSLKHFNIPFKDLPAGSKEDDIPKENIWRYVGPNERLRASHRAVVPEPGLSAEQRALLGEAYVWHPHDHEEKLGKGEIYELYIHLWPGRIVFQKGESLSFQVSGFLQVRPEFEPLLETLQNFNRGSHTIHAGENMLLL